MDDPVTFFGAGMILFFFWVYGIASFILDVKNKFIPLGRQYLRGRRKLKEEKKKKKEREEREEQLL